MATIKFYPYKDSGKSKVYIRLHEGKKLDIRLSTGLSIENAKDWDYSENLPNKKSREVNNKNLRTKLHELENFIDSEILRIEKSTSESTQDLSSKWLNNLIQCFFNEKPIEDMDLLVTYAKFYAESLKTRTFQRNGRRLPYKQITIDKYVNFARLLENYQTYSNRTFRLSDVDGDFTNGFLDYLASVEKKAVNTNGREAKRLKTIIADAEINGRKINPKYKEIKGYEDETVVTYLTFDELDTIIETEMPTEKLQIAKDWLIIGCFTAQRISDLYRMRKEMIITENGISYITFKQFKTGKQVKIPIFYKVEDVLKRYGNDFPPNIYENEKSHRTELSNLLKEVCRISGITQMERGRFNGIIGDYPKHKLIQNHSCRRSFATNFYGLDGWTTPMIMEITGHETEKSFYKYIDKDNFYLSEKAAVQMAKMKERDLEEKRKLRVLKAVNG